MSEQVKELLKLMDEAYNSYKKESTKYRKEKVNERFDLRENHIYEIFYKENSLTKEEKSLLLNVWNNYKSAITSFNF